MSWLSKGCSVAAFMLLGAQALMQYLIYTRPGFEAGMEHIQSTLSLGFLTAAFASSCLYQPKTGRVLRNH